MRVRTIAESLIKRAQSKFEKERRPYVIHHAERFFLDVTDSAYQAAYSPLGSSEINVRDAAGNIRTPQQLSRGTHEQLFLALRFGLILELGQRSERLPVIVDEALVNFDPTRAPKPPAHSSTYPRPTRCWSSPATRRSWTGSRTRWPSGVLRSRRLSNCRYATTICWLDDFPVAHRKDRQTEKR